MLCRQIGLAFSIAGILTACASVPTATESDLDANDVADVDRAVIDNPVADTNYLGDAHPDSIRECRKVATTGSYVKRTVCGPNRDDRELLQVITSPPH